MPNFNKNVNPKRPTTRTTPHPAASPNPAKSRQPLEASTPNISPASETIRTSNAQRPSAQRKSGAAGSNVGESTSIAAVAKKHTKRNVGIAVGVVVVLAAVVIALVVAFGNQDGFYDSNSLVGQAPYKTQEEIQAELDRKVEEGMLNISIASVIEFEDGTSEGVAYIENVPNNHYVMKVDIVLDDTGETIYESGGIKPGNYIEKIRLNRDLDPGTYEATATFHALNPDSLDEVGTAAAVVTLEVLG